MSRAELRAIGVSETQIRSWLRTGRLHSLHRGVYVAGRRAVGRRGRWRAAALAVGPDAAVAGRSAAAAHGWMPDNHRAVDVVVARRALSRPGIRVIESCTLTAEDRTIVGAVPVTGWARTLVDLAAESDARTVRRAVSAAERQGEFDLPVLERTLARNQNRAGTGKLRSILQLWVTPPFTRSEAELRFYELVRDAGLPRPAVNAWAHGFELDFWWEAERLVVEVDGRAWHHGGISRAADSERDAELAAAGVRVLRVGWREIEQRGPLLRRLARALGASL